MTVFSSLQTLAEQITPGPWKWEFAGPHGGMGEAEIYGKEDVYIGRVEHAELDLDGVKAHADLIVAVVNAWPLLEAAVKALEEIADVDWRKQGLELVGEFETDARDIFPRRLRHLRETARAPLVSLTGEPR